MGAVDTTYTFTATDTITSTKMNNIIDQTTITGDAILGTTLEVASGKLKIRSQGITSNELAANAVTATQITSGSVEPSKLSTGYPSWTTSGNLTVNGSSTALSSISSGTASVSIGSARTASGESNIDFNSTFPVTSYEARISRESGADGNLVLTNTGNGTIKFNDIPLGKQDGVAPIYGARAFANFNCNGVTGTNNAIIRTSSNISSITRVSIGKYTVNFTVAMPSANYSLIGTCNDNITGAAGETGAISVYAQTANSASIIISDANSAALYDPLWCNIVIFN